MPKLSLIILIIAILGTDLGINSLENWKFSSRWTSQTEYIPYFVNVNDKIVSVNWRKNNSIHVQSEPSANIGPCEIPVDVNKYGEFVGDHLLVVRALGNGKIIVGNVIFDPSYKFLMFELFVIINPAKCTAKVLKLPAKNELRFYRRPVTYNDSFDLLPEAFQNLSQTPALSRYNDEGELMNVSFSLDPQMKWIGDPVHSYIIKDKDPSEGYLVAVQNSETLVLNLLNSKYELTKQIRRQGYELSSSTSSGSITVCYRKQENMVCEFFDKELNSKMEVIIMEKVDGRLWTVWVNNLPDGGAMILAESYFWFKAEDPLVNLLYLQRIFANGTKTEPTLFYRHDGSYYYPEPFLMNNGEYCVANGDLPVEKVDMESNISTINVTCIDTTK